MTLITPTVRKFCRIVSGLSLGASMPNLKFVALALTEILAFNAYILRGHVTLVTPPFTLLTIGGWRPPSDVVQTMNRYNWSAGNAREVFQLSR